MEKSIADLAAELLIKNQYAGFNSTIEVKDECGNQFTFLFCGSGYNEYHTYCFKCHSDLYEEPIVFGVTTISENLRMDYFKDIEKFNQDEMVVKHEKTLRRAIELALPVKPTEWKAPYETQSWW
jgi:hypothetical protein